MAIMTLLICSFYSLLPSNGIGVLTLPRNGSGTYSLPSPENPISVGSESSSTNMNTTLTDVGTALTNSLCANGEKVVTANQPMGNYVHTGVGNATARTNYAAAGQVQDSSLQWLGSIAGTNTITASLTPAITSYTNGQAYRFIPANTITGAATININSVGAKSLVKNHATGYVALGAGELVAGRMYNIVYDDAGSDQFVVLNPSPLTVTGFVSASQIYINVDGHSTTTFDVTTNVTESTFESVGPTGSGATNIWTAMDTIPTTATMVILNVLFSARPDGLDRITSIAGYARQTGSAAALAATQMCNLGIVVDDYSGGSGASRAEITVPLDSSRRFDFTWVSSNILSAQMLLYVNGFVI
jgi:hypothetical protein